MLTNLLKAVVAVAVSPAALVADIVTLPDSAYEDRHPFGWTGAMLKAAGRNIAEAVKPEK